MATATTAPASVTVTAKNPQGQTTRIAITVHDIEEYLQSLAQTQNSFGTAPYTQTGYMVTLPDLFSAMTKLGYTPQQIATIGAQQGANSGWLSSLLQGVGGGLAALGPEGAALFGGSDAAATGEAPAAATDAAAAGESAAAGGTAGTVASTAGKLASSAAGKLGLTLAGFLGVSSVLGVLKGVLLVLAGAGLLIFAAIEFKNIAT